ncbi:MAG TPA: FmdB family zinc ribbon protein [Vicinamibacterales bacterium]|nr:FmdB family zinc ribbon protein [Vicinamibacterales bacterium]
MPLYEYKCEACGNQFEKIQKFSDPPLDACPSCGGKVEKLLSSPAIQFKGSGWYITDYAKKSSGEAKPSGSGSTSSDSSSDKKSGSDSAASSSAPAAATTTATSKE